MEFYTALVEWSEGEVSYVQVFWTWADHIGIAIEGVLRCAELNEIPSPHVAELDPFKFEDLPKTASTCDGVTYVSDSRGSFPTEPCFRLPSGVVFSCIEGPHLAEEIKVGYSIKASDDGLIELKAVVDQESLIETYLHLVRLLPDIQVFWIKLQADWDPEDDEEQIYTNEGLDEVQKIRHFLEETAVDTLMNGHVTITTYSEAGATNLNISDHKNLVSLSYDGLLIDALASALEADGIHRLEPLKAVDQEYHHWHFRPSVSLAKKDLISALEARGFVRWKPAEK